MSTPTRAVTAPDQIQTDGESPAVVAARLVQPIHNGTSPMPVTKPHAERPGSSRLASMSAPALVITAMIQP